MRLSALLFRTLGSKILYMIAEKVLSEKKTSKKKRRESLTDYWDIRNIQGADIIKAEYPNLY